MDACRKQLIVTVVCTLDVALKVILKRRGARVKGRRPQSMSPSMATFQCRSNCAKKPGGSSLATDPGLGSHSPSKGGDCHHFPPKNTTILVWSVENGFYRGERQETGRSLERQTLTIASPLQEINPSTSW